MRNKKGSIGDGIFLVVSFFVIAIIFIFAYQMMTGINEGMQDSDGVSDHGKELMESSTNNFASLFNNIFFYFFIGLILAVIIGAYFIKVHPALYWISVPILAFIIWLSAIFSNIYKSISTSENLAASAAEFGYITFIFDHYVYFVTGIVLLLSLALFAKRGVLE